LQRIAPDIATVNLDWAVQHKPDAAAQNNVSS
jgi:hypothetical protein